MYLVINESGQNYTNIKNKLITGLTGDCDENDTECVQNMKKTLYFCTAKDECYNAYEEESGQLQRYQFLIMPKAACQ